MAAIKICCFENWKQPAPMELWPHLEILEIATCEAKDDYTEPEIQQLALCNLKIISPAIHMMKKIRWGKKGQYFSANISKHFFSTEKKKNPSNINSQEKNGHHYQEETAVSSLKSLKWLYLSQTESIFFNFANHELLNSTQWGRLIFKKKKKKVKQSPSNFAPSVEIVMVKYFS